MQEFTIWSTEFIPNSGIDKPRHVQAVEIINNSVVLAAKFVLIETTEWNDLSLKVFRSSGLSHLDVARRSETMREWKFFGAWKIKDIGKDSINAAWGSETCKHEDQYGYDTPQRLEEEELTAILELVKTKAVECLEGVIWGD